MARFSLVGNEAIEPNFKRHGDGWLFRAQGWSNPDARGVFPAPWGTVSYIVSDDQKAAIDSILRAIVDFVAKVTIGGALASGALLGTAIWAFHVPTTPVGVFLPVFTAAWTIIIFALVVLFATRPLRRFRQELRAVLADAPRSGEGVRFAEWFEGFALAMSRRKVVLGFILIGLSLASNAQQLIVSLSIGPGSGPSDWGRVVPHVMATAPMLFFFLALLAILIIRIKARGRAAA